ncbi:MAG: hypothetical protein ACRDRH_06005 [Pseudonocardia sp.]
MKIETGPRSGTVRPEFAPIVRGVAFVPERVPREEATAARKLLDRDGAVILTGWPVERDSAVCAALAAQIRADTPLAAGEILLVDNYRCLHGVRSYEGSRTSYVARCQSQDAR